MMEPAFHIDRELLNIIQNNNKSFSLFLIALHSHHLHLRYVASNLACLRKSDLKLAEDLPMDPAVLIE